MIYCADITLFTLHTGDQMNTLACVMEQILTDKEIDSDELMKKATDMTECVFTDAGFESKSLLADTALRWYEEIRPLDAFCCANRMRGLTFSDKDGDAQ